MPHCLTSFQITSRPVLVSEKISQKCENASGFWIKVESRTYIYLDFYARCFYPGKFASFIFKYLRGISNWFQSGGEDWGLRMDTRISIQNIFIRNLNVRPHAAGTHTHTHTHHTWLILLQAGDIRAIYCQISELGKNTTTRLIWSVQKYITYFVSFMKSYQLINSFISRQMPHCKLFIPYLQIRKIILLLILCLYFNICIYYFVFDLYCKLCKVWSIFSWFCL